MTTPLRWLRLGGLRLSSLGLLLAQNFLLVRYLPLAEIGLYYVIGTIAYLGNAGMFVGADLGLQQRLRHLSVDRALGPRGLARYVAVTGAWGVALVLPFACGYALINDLPHWALMTALCVTLAVGTYVSGLGRNLCQLAGLPAAASLGPIVDGSVRCATLGVLVWIGGANALSVVAASVLGAFTAALLTLSLLLRGCTMVNADYLTDRRSLVRKMAQIGGGGLTNWCQLQGWRPLIAARDGTTQAVGVVSFLMTLGSTAASAVFTVIALVQMPRLYSSGGRTSGRYLRQIVVAAAGLAVLSLPAGWVFLQAVGRAELVGMVWLVATGVFLEAGNAVVGVCTNHLNVCERSLGPLWSAGVVGCAMTLLLIVFPPFAREVPVQLALALVAGQLCTVTIVLLATFPPFTSTGDAES